MNKFIFFRTDRIGDFLLSAVLIKSIKRNDSSNHITVVASRKNFYFIYIFFKVTRYRIKDNEKHFNI